jgi:hypothetical protein
MTTVSANRRRIGGFIVVFFGLLMSNHWWGYAVAVAGMVLMFVTDWKNTHIERR